jgi:TPR repeat protein
MQLIEPGPQRPTLEQGFSLLGKGDFGRAILVMDELIKEDAYLSQAYWGRALCYDYRAAGLEDCERAISDYTKSIVYAAEPSALSYGRRGILYFKTGEYGHALEDLNRALAIDLFWNEAQFYRGRTLLALGRSKAELAKAEEDFSDVLRGVDEPFAPAHFWRAQVRRMLNREAEALQDYAAALKADPDDVLALNALGYCFQHGIGTPPSLKDAEALYGMAAERGYTIAQKNLAWLLGDEAYGNAAKSAYWMRRAAKAGDAEAQNIYGLRRLSGKGTERDEFRAAHYFRLAAEQGYAPAICNLADCHERGEGVARDEERAFGLYEKAAALGSPHGKYSLARCHYFGIGTAEDNEKAFATAKPVADEGYARAQDLIGMCYERGHGTEQSHRLAGKYYRAAYKQGHVHAGVHLALRYRYGRGVKRNMAEALRLLEEAAEKGSSYARLMLGRVFFEELNDYGNAAKHLREALREGEGAAAVMLARALLSKEKPEPQRAHRLLLKESRVGEGRLAAAVFLCELELMGAYGFTPDPEAALKRLENLIAAAENEGDLRGVSCAYIVLAQAKELGIGTQRDQKEAVRLYLKAGETARREREPCRCFVASFGHMLYQDDAGSEKDERAKAADEILANEMQKYEANEATKLLYIWSRLRENAPQGPPEELPELIRLAEKLARTEPRDPAAAYTLYYLKRGEKNKTRLKEALKTASPYMRHKIERHMQERPDEPMYPFLTAEDVDNYELTINN